MTKEESALQKVLKKMINNGTGDDLVVAVLGTSLDSIIESLVGLTRKFPLADFQMQDFLHNIEVGRAIITVLKYFTADGYSDLSSYLNACENLIKESPMEIGDDLPDGDTKVSLELEEALFCARLGLEVVIYCNIHGVSTSEVKELIRLRGEYLKQEPEPSQERIQEFRDNQGK